mmetsp:Transcript_20633/g.69025  ORF Transcript_20633/g.69025 Transcript_20633/m.69025 type:complete len:211 (+) Transcript_20633:2400-3032(+)
MQHVPIGSVVQLRPVGADELVGDDDQPRVLRPGALAEEGNPLLGDAASGREEEEAIVHQHHVDPVELEQEGRDVGAADAADRPRASSSMALRDVVPVVGSTVPRHNLHQVAQLPQSVDHHSPPIGAGADAGDGRPLREEQEAQGSRWPLHLPHLCSTVFLGALPPLFLALLLLLPAARCVQSDGEHAMADAAHLPAVSVSQVDLQAVEAR